MNTAEIKNHIHKLVVETNDLDILSKIQSYFEQLRAKNTDWWDDLTDEQKKDAQTGLNQLENGEGISHEEVRNRINKMLGKNA